MVIGDPYKSRHIAFRKYLVNERGLSKPYVKTILTGGVAYLPALVRIHKDPSFTCLYSDDYDILSLVKLKRQLSNDPEWINLEYGYTALKALELYTEFLAFEQGVNIEEVIVDEPDEDQTPEYIEGDSVERLSKVYERDPKLRAECIRKYGCRCMVCGFDFGQVYGEAGAGFIEIHHLRPLSVDGKPHKATADDLRPLCSNCHSIIHRRKDSVNDPERHYYTIDELKDMMSKGNG